jgi:hypothetical protein
MSRKQVALTLAVVALIGIAGCMGGSSGTTTTTTTDTTTTETTTQTATPTTTTTTTTSLSSVSLPEGVSESSVSESTLLRTHTQSLQGISYKSDVTVQIISAVEAENPDVLSQSSEVRANLQNQEAVATTSFDGETRRIKYMGEGTVFTKATPKDGSASYSVSDRSLSPSELTGVYHFEKYFKGLQFKPEETVTMDGKTLIKLRVTGYEDKQFLSEQLKASSMSQPSGTALVTTDGRFKSLDFEIPFSPKKSDTKSKASVSVSTTAEDVAISEPSWTAQAAEQSVDVEVDVHEQTYLSISPQNGKLPKGSTFHFYTESTGNQKVTLDTTVESGDTLYLYVKNGGVKVSTSTPSDGAEISSYSMVAVAPDGTELFRSNG